MQLQNSPDPFNDSLTDEVASDPTDTQGLVRRAAEMIKADIEPKTWQAFWRSVVVGHDSATIAADLNMKPNAIRQERFRVLARLRETLGDDVRASTQ